MSTLRHFSILSTTGRQSTSRAGDDLQRLFDVAGSFSEEEGKTDEGKIFLSEVVSVLDKTEIKNRMFLLCPSRLPENGESSNSDFLASCGLFIWQVTGLPSDDATVTLPLQFIGPSHNDLPVPDFVSGAVLLKTPARALSVAAGSFLEETVKALLSEGENARKRFKGENNCVLKSSGDDEKGVMDKDGVVHPSENKKRDIERLSEWTAFMRLVNEPMRKAIMGNDGVPEWKKESILRRLESSRSISASRKIDDPLSSLAQIDRISHLPAVKDEEKMLRMWSMDFQRSSPLLLTLADFYDGTRTEVYPPSTTDYCSVIAMERLSRMFLGLEKFLTTFCDPQYRGVFDKLRDQLEAHSFGGRRHVFAFLYDSAQGPLFRLSITLREEKETRGCLRGPANVRALLEQAYAEWACPNFDGPSQSLEHDFLHQTYKRIVWCPTPASPPPAAQPSALVPSQGVLTASQLKKMLKLAKASTPSVAVSTPAPPLLTSLPPAPSGRSQANATAPKKGICLQDMALLLGASSQPCPHAACHFQHAPLNGISKVDAMAAVEKVKKWPLSVTKPALLTAITASTVMPL